MKSSLVAFSSLAMPFPPVPEEIDPSLGIGRVAYHHIGIYEEPFFKSQRLRWLQKDDLIELLNQITAINGPAYNPTWYRTQEGFVHSAYVQPVAYHINTPLSSLPKSGRLCEVTAPFVQSYQTTQRNGWSPAYRLYYGSVHWVTTITTGPDDRPWYQITDDRLRIHYYVPAHRLRPISYDEISPLSIHIAPQSKRIEVSLGDQTLTAYEGDTQVFQSRISTGVPSTGPTPNGIPTTTPSGRFNISYKMPVRHMGEGELAFDPTAYELPGVPWCCFFVSTGVAFHGTYWHNNFGNTMSHGCVNMRNEDAKWLFRWTTPIYTPGEWYSQGRGTLVHVF